MAEQTLKEKTAKGLFWGGLNTGIQQILNVVFGVFLARLLSPGDYGLVGMLGVFMGIAPARGYLPGLPRLTPVRGRPCAAAAGHRAG